MLLHLLQAMVAGMTDISSAQRHHLLCSQIENKIQPLVAPLCSILSCWLACRAVRDAAEDMPSGQDAEKAVNQASDQNVKPAAGKIASKAEPAAKELTDKQVWVSSDRVWYLTLRLKADILPALTQYAARLRLRPAADRLAQNSLEYHQDSRCCHVGHDLVSIRLVAPRSGFVCNLKLKPGQNMSPILKACTACRSSQQRIR